MIRAALIWSAIFVATIGRVMAQIPPLPVPPNFWDRAWEVSQAAGIFGTAILGYILWRVDKERVAYRTSKDEQTEKYIEQMKTDAIARAKTEELAQKYILGVEAMNQEIKRNKAGV